MGQITYQFEDGTAKTVDFADGQTVMSVAVGANVEGIVGDCGGSMICATCHCYVDDAWGAAFAELSDGEDDILDCIEAERKPTSRLGCQMRLGAAHDGLIVHIPDVQR